MTIKTNNIQDLLKAKGISTVQKKNEPKEEYGQGIKRLYNLEPASPPPLSPKFESNKINLYPRKVEFPVNILSETGENKLNTNRTQTEHKVDTNRTQTEHKVDTNRTQTEHKKGQTRHKPDTNRTQTEHKLNTELNTELNTRQIKEESNHTTNLSFFTLAGLQRKLLLFFFQNCKNRRSNTTQELTVQYIADHQNIPFGSVKTTIIRLEKKGFVKRFTYKNGRGGWASFEIPDPVYRDIFQYEASNKLDTMLTKNEAKLNTELNTKLNTKLNTNSLYSSSIINTTTTDLEILIIPPQLQEMGVSLRTLESYMEKMSSQEIQQSIDAFNYDLNNGLVKSSTPLNMLFGILKKGRSYLSSHFTEQLNRDVTEAVKRAEEAEQKHKALEEANFKTKFYEWRLNNKEEVELNLAFNNALK